MSVDGAISRTRHELSSILFFLQSKVPKKIQTILTETLVENAPFYAIVKNWVAEFKHNFSTYPRPEWPKTVNTPEIIDQIQEIILDDCKISAKSIAEQLGILRECVGSIICEDLDVRKLSAKWFQKWLHVNQKCQ